MLSTVAAGKAVARAALLQLLAGPRQADAGRGLVSFIPDRTRLLGVSVSSGTATVDLSSAFAKTGGSFSMTARLAEVAYTVTQFPTVARVVFWLDGEPMKTFDGGGIVLDHPWTRGGFEALTPAILLESPSAGGTVVSPVRLSGAADVFEGVLEAELTDLSGHVIAHQIGHASAGTGTRGSFSVSLEYTSAEARKGFVVLYDVSPKDGTHEHITRIPVEIGRS